MGRNHPHQQDGGDGGERGTGAWRRAGEDQPPVRATGTARWGGDGGVEAMPVAGNGRRMGRGEREPGGGAARWCGGVGGRRTSRRSGGAGTARWGGEVGRRLGVEEP